MGDSVEDLSYNIYDECKDTDPEPGEKPSDLDPASGSGGDGSMQLKKDCGLVQGEENCQSNKPDDRKERERASTADNLKKDYYLTPTKVVGDLDPLEPPEGDTDEADVTPRDQEDTGVEDTSYASPYGLGVSDGVADIREEDGYETPCYRKDDRDSQNRLGSDSSKPTEHPTPEGTEKKTYYSSLDARDGHGYGSINH